MPLYVQNGKLIQKAGALGTSAGCCCGVVVTTNCCGAPRAVPSQVSVEITIGDLSSVSPDPGSGWCHDDFKSYVNGTYFLDFLSDFGGLNYSWTGSDGRQIALAWYCNADAFGRTGSLTHRYCDLSECYQRINWDFTLVQASPAPWVVPPFCTSIAGGTISPNNAADVYGYDKDLSSCSETIGFSRARFQWSIVITPL
jgi:hypothetical protein